MPKRTREHHAWLLSQLADPRTAANYLNEARQESKKAFLKALRNVAEVRRIAVVAQDTGLNRESLYKALSEGGNPRLETYDSVLNALGLDYSFQPKHTILTPVPPAPVGPAVASAHFDINPGNVISTTAKNEDEDVKLIPSGQWSSTFIEIETSGLDFEMLSTGDAGPQFTAGTSAATNWQTVPA